MRAGEIAHNYIGEGCTIKDFEKKFNNKTYERPFSGDDKRKLVTDTMGFVMKEQTCFFGIRVDYAVFYEGREGPQSVIFTAKLNVRAQSNGEKMEVYCFGGGKESNEVIDEITRIIGKSSSFVHLDIIPKKIAEVVAKDSLAFKGGYWKDLDPNTKVGYLGGELDHSRFKPLFEEDGESTSAKFESRKMDRRKVRVTHNGSVTVWGKDVTQAMVVDYFENVIKPILRGEPIR